MILTVNRCGQRLAHSKCRAQMDYSTGMSYLQNQIQHKNQVETVKTVFLCDVLIRHFCLKLILLHIVFKLFIKIENDTFKVLVSLC